MISKFRLWNQSVERSAKGEDYPNGLMQPNGHRVYWDSLPAYKPYLEAWKNRPEYKRVLNKKN